MHPESEAPRADGTAAGQDGGHPGRMFAIYPFHETQRNCSMEADHAQA